MGYGSSNACSENKPCAVIGGLVVFYGHLSMFLWISDGRRWEVGGGRSHGGAEPGVALCSLE